MNRHVLDETSTSDVVWAAAERIGKASNAEDINRICEYLVSKHWFQNAGDLRVARQNAHEWQALEVPGRLKIAIQEVLDASAGAGSQSPGKSLVQSPPVIDSTEVPAATTEQSTIAGDSNASYHHLTVDLSEGYEHASLPTYDQYYHQSDGVADESALTQACSDQIERVADGDADAAAAHAAAWEAYYAANGYYQYYDENGVALSSWDYNTPVPVSATATDCSREEEIVVEAQEVVVEDAVAVDAAVDTLADSTWQEHDQGNAATPDMAVNPPVVTWHCGQCTFENTVDVAFCAMCYGHISLSTDASTTTPPPLQEPLRTPSTETALESSPIPPPAPLPVSHSTDPAPPSPLAVARSSPSPTARPHGVDQPLFMANLAPTEPISPLYSPSAPDFDCMTLEDEPSQLKLDIATKESEVLGPALVTASQPSPSPPKTIDYRALAFKRTPSMPSTMVSTSMSPTKSPVRSATEFTF